MRRTGIATICWFMALAIGAQAQDPFKPNVSPPRGKAPASKIEHGDAPTEAPGSPEFDAQPAGGQSGGADAGTLAPIDNHPPQRLRPPELLAEALLKPREGALVGKPLTLLAALSRSADRSQQLRIAQAYWRLCTAQADYHWALDQRDRLALFTEKHVDSPSTLSARASARADVRDTQLAVDLAQQELLDLMGAAGDEEPPLASDRPHVGPYTTQYEQVFANRVPPPRIRLIHRTLPVLRKAIDDHGEAILATLDALESTGDDFQKSGQGLATVLVTCDQLRRERRAFMNDVRDYNQQIAEYVFAVMPPGADQGTLVSKLIKTAPRANPPPPRNDSSSRDPRRGNSAVRATFNQRSPSDDADLLDRTSNYQPEATAIAPDAGLYDALLALDAPERAQKLADLLHWDRSLPPEAGSPASLADCLQNQSGEHRLRVITLYWQTRERVARYQVLHEQSEQLNALQSVAISLRDQPGIAGASVRLQAARRSARAAVADAEAAVLDAQFELTLAAGRRLEEAWLLPSTLPQAAGYEVNTQIVAGDSRHWAQVIRLQQEKLAERTEAVLQADADRAAAASETRQGAEASAASQDVSDEPMRLDGALRTIGRQSQLTLSLLRDLTAYNLAIARYAVAAVSDSATNDELLKKLTVVRANEDRT